MQGKTEEVEKIERKIDLIISGTGGIITENENEEDRVGHDDNLSCETTQKHEENSTETQPPDTKRSKIATENANKRKCFQKEIRDDTKALWDTLEQLKNLIVTISNNTPTSIQPINRDNKTDDSTENKNEGKEKQDENHKEITRKAKSRTMRDSLITEFLKPIDKNENKIQAEHLKRICELESRCCRLEKEKTLLQKELDDIRSVHKKPPNQKNKPGHQKKQKQDNPNQLPVEQESRGEALKLIAPTEKTGRNSHGKEHKRSKKQQQQGQQQQQNANQTELRQKGQLQGQGTIKQPAIDDSRVLVQKHKEKYQLRSGTTVVAGDSILKGLKGWLMARDGSIKVHSFAGATTQDMQDYIKPLLSRKPSRIVLHTGTNDLLNELDAEQIADKIFELGRKIVNSGTSCTISTLVERQDELNSMVRDVNKFLIQNLCSYQFCHDHPPPAHPRGFALKTLPHSGAFAS